MYYKICPICHKYKGTPICKWCNIKLNFINNILNKEIHSKDFKFENFYNYTFEKSKKEKILGKQHQLFLLLVCIANRINEDFTKDAYQKIDYIIKKHYADIAEYLDTNKFINDFITDYISKTNIENSHSQNDYRKQFPADILCQDGHYVRSKEERAIDDYLYQTAKLLHAYEPKFRLTPEEQAICKKTGKEFEFFYPDFYIPEFNLYIEFFGKNEEKYNLKTDLKIKIYKSRKNINFAYLTYNDSNILLEKLEDILDNFRNGNNNSNEDNEPDILF